MAVPEYPAKDNAITRAKRYQIDTLRNELSPLRSIRPGTDKQGSGDPDNG